jgi:hypothetical protein
MNSPAASTPIFDEPYEVGAGQGRVTGVPIGIWSSKAFVARWQAAAGGLEANLSESTAGRLRGTITNKSNSPLSQCVLMFGNSAWPIGTIEAGETKRPEDLDPQSYALIESFLVRRQEFATKAQVAPYDRTDADVARILEIMMFHELAGGSNYSGLLNRQQRYLDLGNQLEFGKAVLVCRATSGAVVKIDGETVAAEAMNKHDSIYRYVLPVKAR